MNILLSLCPLWWLLQSAKTAQSYSARDISERVNYMENNICMKHKLVWKWNVHLLYECFSSNLLWHVKVSFAMLALETGTTSGQGSSAILNPGNEPLLHCWETGMLLITTQSTRQHVISTKSWVCNRKLTTHTASIVFQPKSIMRQGTVWLVLPQSSALVVWVVLTCLIQFL